jgi:predicted ATP-dependent endonuclease of OLD family
VLILTFPLFKHGTAPLLAFIEEPELFMHPWLHRVFLDTLTRRFPEHHYFLTTHSNHLLDLTLDFEDVSIFALEKEFDPEQTSSQQQAKFRITNVSAGDHHALQLLGVRNSSVFLSNCTIWVEGITDRRYIAHWLKLYMEASTGRRRFKEDLHYSFVEYSGSNITHWSFLDETGPNVDRLCGKLFLIADSDNAKPGEKKFQRLQQLKDKLGDRFHCLPAKEIENLLSPHVLKAVLRAFGEADANVVLPRAHESYLNKPLGTFIESQMIKPAKSNMRRYADGKTIRDKLPFCEKAVVAMRTWDDVSEHAQRLTEQLIAFIETNNAR